MNRLFNKLLGFGLKSVSNKQFVNEIQFQRNHCFFRNNFNSNQPLIVCRNLLSVKRFQFYQSFNGLSNVKKRQKSDEISIDNEILSLKSKKRLMRKKAVPEVSDDSKPLPVLAFSTAEEYNIEELAEGLKDQGLYELMPFISDEIEDCLHLTAKYQINHIRREIFIFREGSIVCWNMPYVECEAILKLLKAYEHNPYDQTLVDEEQEEMHFEFINSKSKLQKGLIYITNRENIEESDLEKYSFSDAIALSVKLSIWESCLDRYIHSIEFVSQDMKAGHKIKLSRDQVFRKTGELFDLKHHINLSSDLLDTPDFYWDRQELEKLFLDTIYFMNIKKRTKVLNEKLNHCIELMQLLSSHLNDKHNSTLEWMIIVLIMVEVVFEFIHYAERLF